MKKTFFAALFAIVANAAMAQAPKPEVAKDDVKKSIPSPLIPHLQLRSNFDDNGKKPAPALLMFSFPDGKAKSWLVDAALAYQFEKTSANYTNKIVAEFHKNNLIEKEQQNFAAGYSGSWQQNADGANILATNSAKYVRDWQNQSHSLALISNWSLLNTTSLRINAPGYLDKGNRLSYMFSPVGGIEYQNVLQTKTGLLTGNTLRLVGSLSLGFNFHKKQEPGDLKVMPKIFSINAGYTGRYAAVNSTGSGEDKTFMFKAGADFYVIDVDDTEVSIGFKFNNGSNPLTGLKPQRFGQLSLNVQF